MYVSGNVSLNAVAMALAGYNEATNHLWRKTCGTQRRQLSSPYLRAIFAFLASDNEYYDDVLVSACQCPFVWFFFNYLILYTLL